MTSCRFTVCGIPEIGTFRAEKVTHVVSIADPGTPVETYFLDYDPHHRLDLRFHDIIEERPGEIAPQRADIETILAFGEEMARHGTSLRHLLVHCHMGVSRSTAAMAMLLLQRMPGREEEVVETVTSIRPQAWPNSRMLRFAEEALGSRGRLAAAFAPQYRRVAETRPDLVAMLREVGREREIPEGF